MRNNALTKKGRKWVGATEAAGALTGNKTMESEGRVERRSAQRTTYRVVPQPEGGWIVESGEFGQVAGVHRTKEEALRSAREVARAHQPGQVLVSKKDETVQAEPTYG
jgi:predicted RNase H-like HicB family nuclease